MVIGEFLALLKGVKKSGGGSVALCPGHDDRRRSLSVREGDDRRILVKCHAGCSYQQITAALNLPAGALFPDDERRPSMNGHAPCRELATYDYHDEHRTLLYQVLRLQPKNFRMRRPDGPGGWTWSIAGVRRVPYRLPQLSGAVRVYHVEGEKCADALAALGLRATTTAGGAESWRDEYADQVKAAGVAEAIVLPDRDAPGEKYAGNAARGYLSRGLRVKILHLPELAEHGDVVDWLAAGGSREQLEALADAAPVESESCPRGQTAGAPEEATADVAGAAEPKLLREGLDLALVWPDGIRFSLRSIRDGRDGLRGELTVTQAGRRLSWGSFALSSTSARETLRKKLEATAPEHPWGEYLEEAAFRLTEAARQGEPIVTLTGTATSPTRELLRGFLYEGEPTVIYGDGDTGKSLVALAIAAAVHSGAALPFGLKPARAVPAAYLDWETSRDTLEARVALLAAGLGIDPPAIVYKRMTRPLVDEAGALAAEFARRGIGLVVIDSKMFAVAGGEGAAFHEPITAFYNALRLFAPAASLVLNHVTNADARSGGPGRPFGGAFAFNGPRLIWEAKRDQDIDDATAIAFTCRKANNLPRRPDPFGLRFQPGDGTITVYPFDLSEASPNVVAGAGLAYRVRLALATGALTAAELAEHLDADEKSVRRTLERMRSKGATVTLSGAKPQKWGLASG